MRVVGGSADQILLGLEPADSIGVHPGDHLLDLAHDLGTDAVAGKQEEGGVGMVKPYVLSRVLGEFDSEFDRTGHLWLKAGTGTGSELPMTSRWLTSLLTLNLTLASGGCG